ncbi:MAG TPA: DUF2059 domain-containing protein [Candidatus Acidoferrales bacterium]|jgi:hypothetical protein
MKLRTALIAAVLFVAGPALAQAPAGNAPQKPAQHAPGVATAPAQSKSTAAAPAAAEKPDPAKEKAIRHLMVLTGTDKLGQQITESLTDQVKQAISRSVAPERMDKFMDDFNQKLALRSPAAHTDEELIAGYSSRFSTQEIEGLSQFYESPLGQKMEKEMPQLMREAQITGINLQREAAISTLREMTGDYPEIKQLLPPEEPQPGTPAAAPAPQAAPEAAPQAPQPKP